MPLPRVTIEGRLVTEPELRFLPSGVAVCGFRVAANQQKKNEQTQQWEDDKSCFLSVSVWRDMAENVAASLHKGDPVLINGTLWEDQYETKDGDKRTSMKVDAFSVGPDLRWAEANVQRTKRTGGTQQAQPDQWSTPPQNVQQQPAQAAQQPAAWSTPNYDEPPF